MCSYSSYTLGCSQRGQTNVRVGLHWNPCKAKWHVGMAFWFAPFESSSSSSPPSHLPLLFLPVFPPLCCVGHLFVLQLFAGGEKDPSICTSSLSHSWPTYALLPSLLLLPSSSSPFQFFYYSFVCILFSPSITSFQCICFSLLLQTSSHPLHFLPSYLLPFSFFHPPIISSVLSLSMHSSSLPSILPSIFSFLLMTLSVSQSAV